MPCTSIYNAHNRRAVAYGLRRATSPRKRGEVKNYKKLCGSTSTSSLRLPFTLGAAASQSRR
jgi:hypothetical protein